MPPVDTSHIYSTSLGLGLGLNLTLESNPTSWIEKCVMIDSNSIWTVVGGQQLTGNVQPLRFPVGATLGVSAASTGCQ